MKAINKIIPVIFVIAALAGCSMDEETATIVLNLGQAGNARAVSMGEISHVLVFSGPSGTKTVNVPNGGGNISVSVVPGTWTISVTAYFQEQVYAVGSATAEVKAGKSTSVSIQMTVVWIDPNTAGTPNVLPEAGTAANPFKVDDAAALQKIGSGTDGWGMDKHYKITTDITLTLPPSGSSNFTTIGTYSVPFTGSFDGNGNKIINLTIDNPTLNYQGLFGSISGDGVTTGVVKNLILEDANITGASYIGGVVGHNQTGGTVKNCNFTTGSVEGTNGVGGVAGYNEGTVENCNASGDVNGTGNIAGGVVGYNLAGGTVRNCNFTTGRVEGINRVGGVVGMSNGTVENCYATGDVTGNVDFTGGVVGNNTADGTVKNCYATGTIVGNASVGGVVGANGNTVDNCYASGDVTGTGNNVGGVVGQNNGPVENCYTTGSIDGIDYVGGVVGYNTSTVQYCAALNTSVDATGSNVNRVAGTVPGLTNNYAQANMTVVISGGSPITIMGYPVNLNDETGCNVNAGNSTGEYNDQDFWETDLGWDFASIWEMSSGPNSLPVLQNMP